MASANWRNAGTTNVHPELLADLRKKTTYPPILYSNATISVDTVLPPQAGRDTDTPDLGYHYDPLDYLFGGADANANLTFSAGTAVGWFRTTAGWYHAGHGIHIADRKTVTFDGHVDAPNYFVRLNAVQESPGAQLYGPGGITGWASYLTDSPTLQARFTRFAIPGTEIGANHFRDDWGYLIAGLTDCQFSGANQGGYVSTYAFTNCLFDRENLWLQTGAADDSWTLRNCLVRGGSLSLARTTAMPVSIRDCAFDGTTFSTGDAYTNNPSLSDYAYNAYLQGAQQTIPAGTNNVTVTNLYWQAGPLGNYYLPTNSALINAGSRNATNAGLYHYTVRVDQTKEANSLVDIGFHYLALTAESVSNTVWVNDAIPSGATPVSDGGDAWTWISSNPTSYSGSSNHLSNIYSLEHQHFFTGAGTALSLLAGDRLYCYVYLDPTNVPSQVMLQWLSADGTSWGHRAFWGSDSILSSGWWGNRAYLGPLPPSGGWIRLEAPASTVDLDGRSINGMAFTLYGGRASWDYAGFIRPTNLQLPFDYDSDGIPDYLEDRNGNGVTDTGDTDWQSATDLGLKVWITEPKSNSNIP